MKLNRRNFIFLITTPLVVPNWIKDKFTIVGTNKEILFDNDDLFYQKLFSTKGQMVSSRTMRVPLELRIP